MVWYFSIGFSLLFSLSIQAQSNSSDTTQFDKKLAMLKLKGQQKYLVDSTEKMAPSRRYRYIKPQH